jgi:hypothetical protein
MIGNDAFCPESGAPLSEERHYDESGRPLRAVVDDDVAGGGRGETVTAGELTAGARRSSREALLAHFRRCHRRHCREADPALDRAASGCLRRLKRVATGTRGWDVHVWYALQYRLRARGFDVEWMDAHAGLRCPGCHGDLRFEQHGEVVAAYCGTNCDGTRSDRLPDLRSTVTDLVGAAFDDADPDPTEVFRFDQ